MRAKMARNYHAGGAGTSWSTAPNTVVVHNHESLTQRERVNARRQAGGPSCYIPDGRADYAVMRSKDFFLTGMERLMKA